MICANPHCAAQAIYFRSGSLHWINEAKQQAGGGSERQRPIWLCAACTELYVVQTWRPAGEQLRLKSVAPVELPRPLRRWQEAAPVRSTLLDLVAS
ncbi:hypothetical protein [Acidipila rosea]|uniref:Uncharacterized protein n=1 Tax=Acidipila rosea TaxID=768535 RepID=A0A4R1L5Y4_9BACT|nr:hypothetical protein [Acidipila rosea]TCK73562.1 hypothetical protein C7378_1175 [Acidipila rosea]